MNRKAGGGPRPPRSWLLPRSRPGTVMLPRYRCPSDTSDLEWALLERLLPTPACQTPQGRSPREVASATGGPLDPLHRRQRGETAALPADFGIPWRTALGYFARWAKAGVLKRILDQLRRRLRLRSSRCPWPVRVIIDAQSVKGAATISNATRGWDQGKMINGRKRHLIVDQDGLLVDLLVTLADVQERAAARILLTRLHTEHPEIVLVRADNAYGGEEFTTWAQDTLGITIKVVPRPKDADGFVVLSKRWVVERSNSWTMRARRNARDYERLMPHAEAHIQWAFITLMSRRLARQLRRNERSRTPSRQPPEDSLHCRSAARPYDAHPNDKQEHHHASYRRDLRKGDVTQLLNHHGKRIAAARPTATSWCLGPPTVWRARRRGRWGNWRDVRSRRIRQSFGD